MVESAENKGRLIVFEGIDGSGKSTQISLLQKNLIAMGRKVYKTCEPTNTAIGGIIRDTLSGATKRTSTELGALFLTDRIGHNANPINGIMQYVNSGVDVICDRYYYSSFAYQGLDSDLSWLIATNRNCPEILRPDLCIFLDVDAKRCKERVDGSRSFLEIFEQSEEQLNQIRSKFFEVFALLKSTENIVILDAMRDVKDIAADILELTLGL